MSTISFTGSSSVLPRTIFVGNGAITKPPLPLLTGGNLFIVGPNVVEIATGSFNDSYLNKTISILAPGTKNEGIFKIAKVLSPTRVVLSDAIFEFNKYDDLISAAAALNDLRTQFNSHVVDTTYHLAADSVNLISSPPAIPGDVNSFEALLNELLTKLQQHAYSGPLPEVSPPVLYDPKTHYFTDPSYKIYEEPVSVNSLVSTVAAMQRRYNDHRLDRFFHKLSDSVHRLHEPIARTRLSPIGPLSWILSDPRTGQVADESSDVVAILNGTSPASVEAVFGLLGAVVLSSTPSPGDVVTLDYSYIENLPTQFKRLNSSEFVLNQEKNRSESGLPGHIYRQRSFLLDPLNSLPTVRSPYIPKSTGYKYKAYERKYTASLNDPSSLLLNVPNNRIMYPVYNATVEEANVRYDPISLPNLASDSWTFNGSGVISLNNQLSSLNIIDDTLSESVIPGSPFYSHEIDLTYASLVNVVARFSISNNDIYEPAGDCTGVGFGLTDGENAVLICGIKSRATNLSSAIAIINDLKAKFDSHLVQTGVHAPNDLKNGLNLADATSLQGLIALCAALKTAFNNHLLEGPNNVHQNIDTVNPILISDPIDEPTSIAFVNSMFLAFNSHRVASTVHYVNDESNVLNKTTQIGILTNTGDPQYALSYESAYHDFHAFTSYRLYRDVDGNAYLYLSGQSDPLAVVTKDKLPKAAELDIKFNPISQVFFGSLFDSSTNESDWQFVRANIIPETSIQIGTNKSVTYVPITYPDQSLNPWIQVGQGGAEFLTSSPTSYLSIDSMSSIDRRYEEDSGILTGEYRGFLRIEPTLTDTNVIAVEFSTNCTYRSFGVDNRSLGVFLSDGTFSTSLTFLQAAPSKANIVGTTGESSFSINSNDVAIFAVNDGPVLSLNITSLIDLSTYPDPINQLADLLNLAAQETIAAPIVVGSETYLNVFSPTLGASSNIHIIGGSVWAKAGINQGKYFGRDSNPDARFSWSGVDYPTSDSPAWLENGEALAYMQERNLRIEDVSVTTFKTFIQNDANSVPQVISALTDWKLDVRLKIESYNPGDLLNYNCFAIRYCGAFFSVDEGPGSAPFYGKNVYVLFAVDENNVGYLNVRSRNATAPYEFDQKGVVPFAWNDGAYHSYNLFKSSALNQILIYADNTYIGSVPYSDLNQGADGPSLKFGTDDSILTNTDLKSARSITEWKSISVVADSGQLSTDRYIGVYKGGDSSLLSSYYLHQIDWAAIHSYRIVRDPISGITVYVDSNPVPVISAQYDVLTIPSSSQSFLSGLVPSMKYVAFGAFNPEEISRSNWYSINYSLGRLTNSNGFVPPHNLLNQAGVIASPDHLTSSIPHDHFGFKTYSGGTPQDDFIASESVMASEVLYDNTPPVVLTQNLESRGGLILQKNTISSVSNILTVDIDGDIGSKIDDETNLVSVPDALTTDATVALLISETSSLISRFNSHIIKIAPVHSIQDAFNSLSVTTSTFSQACSSLAALAAKFNLHFQNNPVGFHFQTNTSQNVQIKTPTSLKEASEYLFELQSALNLHITSTHAHFAPTGFEASLLPDYISAANYLRLMFNSHISNTTWHTSADTVDSVPNPIAYANDLSSAVRLANYLKSVYNSHIFSTSYHLSSDVLNTVVSPDAVDLSSLVTLLDEISLKYNSHIPDLAFHIVSDTNPSIFYTTYEFAVRIAEQFTDSFNSHIANIQAHEFPLNSLSIPKSATYILDDINSTQTFDVASIHEWILTCKQRSIDHVSTRNIDLNVIHNATDFRTESGLLTIVDPVNVITAVQCIKDVRDQISLYHVPSDILTASSSSALSHNSEDSTNLSTESEIVMPVDSAKLLLDDIVANFSHHIGKENSHLKLQSFSVIDQ